MKIISILVVPFTKLFYNKKNNAINENIITKHD